MKYVPQIEKVLTFLEFAKEKGFFHLLSANFFIQFLGFGTQLFVTKIISPSDVGTIKIIQSYSAIIFIFAGFGFNAAVLKICSEKIDINIKRVVLKKSIIYSLISTILFLILFVFILKVFFKHDAGLLKWFMIYLFAIPAMVYTQLFMSYLQSLKKIKKMASIQTIIKIISFVIVVFCTYYKGLIGFIVSTVAVFYIGLLPLLFENCEDIFSSWKNTFSIRINQPMGNYSIYSTAANVVGTIGAYLDIIIIERFLSDKTMLGYYSIATIFILALNQIVTTIQNIATPNLSDKINDIEKLIFIFKKYQKIMILSSFIITIVSFIGAPFILNLIYGNKYSVVSDFFRIIVWKYFFFSCYALMGVTLFSMGMIKYNFISGLCCLIVSVVINLFMVKYYGIIGVAYAQVIAGAAALIINAQFINIAIKKHKAKEL